MIDQEVLLLFHYCVMFSSIGLPPDKHALTSFAGFRSFQTGIQAVVPRLQVDPT
jgi:hypothetical protein